MAFDCCDTQPKVPLRGELRGLYSSVQAKKEIKKESMTGPGFYTKARAGFCSLRLVMHPFSIERVCAAGCKNSPGSGLAARGGGGVRRNGVSRVACQKIILCQNLQQTKSRGVYRMWHTPRVGCCNFLRLGISTYRPCRLRLRQRLPWLRRQRDRACQ